MLQSHWLQHYNAVISLAQAYYASISYTDYNIGVVLNKLDALGEWEKLFITILIVASENDLWQFWLWTIYDNPDCGEWE